MRINDVLRGKPRQDVVTINPDATVRDLIGMLAEHNVGALIVSVDGTAVDGIVSERDVVRHLLDSDGRPRGHRRLDHDVVGAAPARAPRWSTS